MKDGLENKAHSALASLTDFRNYPRDLEVTRRHVKIQSTWIDIYMAIPMAYSDQSMRPGLTLTTSRRTEAQLDVNASSAQEMARIGVRNDTGVDIVRK